ncbi:MAG TPA: glycosyltransferase [Candidatus Krumholzibacteria bacterium]|nr:glycosyltransferase [Candidatus Krumholzibacteria bacterium]
MEKRRIALVASTFGVGGAEIVTGNVLRRLPRDRYEVRVYFLHEAGIVGRDLLAGGFDGAERLCTRRRDVRGAVQLARRLKEFRPGVVWCLDHIDAMWLGRAAAVVARTPDTVIASHSTGLVGANGRTRPSFGWRERVLMEFVTRVIAVSRTHARYLATVTGLAPARITVIENGIDLARWPAVTGDTRRQARNHLGIGTHEHVVAMVAALRPEKAHEVLFDSIAGLAAQGKRIRVLVAGDGPRRDALRQRAQALGIMGHVDFLGVVRDVAQLLHASDVVVLPSYDVVETLPLSLLEAMACGIPVIATRVGSVPEVVADGETGLLVEPGSAGELAAAIDATLQDPAAALRRAEFARRRVEAYYSVDRTVSGYRRLFDEMIAV